MTKKWRYDVVMEYYDGDTGIYLYIMLFGLCKLKVVVRVPIFKIL